MKLINIIRQAPIEPGMPVPEILIIAPPKIVKPKGLIANKFKNSEKRSVGLAVELEKIAKENSVYYFDAGSVTEASKVDGIHLDEEQHKKLGEAISNMLLKLELCDRED
jgi:lysophospholipase L1-like esterase